MERAQKDMRLRWLAAGGLALTAAWAFDQQALAPLRQRETEARGSIAALEARIADAHRAVGEVRALEAQVSSERSELDSLQNDLPAGSAMIWLPALVKGHFAHFGIAVTIVRLNTTLDEPGMPGNSRGYWSLALPIDEAGRNVTGLLFAVAALEQQHSFVRVLDFGIRPDPENPGRRVAGLNLAVLIRK